MTDPTPEVHPAAAAVSSVLSPPASAPAGRVKWIDFGRAALAALLKSGALYGVLSAIGSVPGKPAIVGGVLAFCVTMLRLFVDAPPVSAE